MWNFPSLNFELDPGGIVFDPNNIFAQITILFLDGFIHLKNKRYKDCIVVLNKLLNDISFKSYSTIESEIKLTLAYSYIMESDLEPAYYLLKAIPRKTGLEESPSFVGIREAVKLLSKYQPSTSLAVTESYINVANKLSEFNAGKQEKVIPYIVRTILRNES